MKKTLEVFIGHLSNEEFADAHEVMEHQWKKYKQINHPLTKLLKGFINGATAFELIKRGRVDAASRLWLVYKKYLPLLTKEIDHFELFFEADAILESLQKERL